MSNIDMTGIILIVLSDLMGEYINNDSQKIHKKVKEHYGLLVEHNPGANYNHQHIYLNL